MKIAVRYYTRSGNTRKLADAIAKALGVEAQDVSVPLSEPVDLLFLGSSVYAGGVDDSICSFLKEHAKKIGTVVNFSTAAVASSTYKQIQKLTREYHISLAEKEFHCRGSFTILHRGHPNAKDLQRASDFARDFLPKK